MPSELLLAPIGAGKTEYALNQLRQVVTDYPFAPIWILLPGNRQEDAFRQRLVESTAERRVYFNITFFSFYTLYARLLDIVGKPQRELGDTARLQLIRSLLIELQENNQLTIFQKIADKSGFAQIIANFIYELKQNVIYPEKFEEVAANGTDKDRDLATIYTAYQAMLRRNFLIDREGEGWLALEEVQKRSETGREVAHLLVDGFDQFNPLQARLLALLAQRVKQTIITLPQVQGREATLGRRFTEAQQRLISAFDDIGERLQIKVIPALHNASRNPKINHLIQHSFANNGEQISAQDAVKLIEAPSPKIEVGVVMRQVKKLLLEGTPPDEILIAVRDWPLYAPHFDSASQRYSIPTRMHYGDSLANNPAIVALVKLLELSRYDFRRRDVMDVLRSPYFAVPGIDETKTNLLDVISREQHIIRGRNDWLDAIQSAIVDRSNEDHEIQTALLSSQEASALRTALLDLFNAITPVDAGDIQTYVAWIENLIGDDATVDPDGEPVTSESSGYSLNMLECLRQADSVLVARDLLALHQVKRVLKGLLASQKLFSSLKLERAQHISRQEFLHDFKSALSTATLTNNTNRSGKVLITSVTDARGLPHEHVFIPGLSEGIFPQPAPEDPIYLDSERQQLTQSGVFLETQAERAADDGLFYELISLPRKSLTVSRPTIQNGAIWPESHLWRAVKMAFNDADTVIERYKFQLGGVVKAEEAANRTETALAVANGLNLSMPGTTTISLYNWMLDQHSEHWQHIFQMRNVEEQRMMSPNTDHYSGRLQNPQLLDWVAGQLDENRIWSASQFNDYGLCGFRFFSKRLLKLEEIEEPETGMDAAQRGTVIHGILEETYRELGRQQISIAPEHVGRALSILSDTAARILPTAPQDYGFRESILWTQEQVTLMRKVEALVRSDFSGESPLGKIFESENRFPYMQEVPLGGDAEHLLINLGDKAIKVSGYVDRIDRIGNRAIVVDYKTGSTQIPKSEMTEGRNFQMMLYLLAGAAILEREREHDSEAPTNMAGGAFWHLNRKVSGALDMDKPEDVEVLQDAQLRLGEHLQQGRAGDFTSVPNRKGNGPCSHYCEFTQLCRVSIMNRQKRV